MKFQEQFIGEVWKVKKSEKKIKERSEICAEESKEHSEDYLVDASVKQTNWII